MKKTALFNPFRLVKSFIIIIVYVVAISAILLSCSGCSNNESEPSNTDNNSSAPKSDNITNITTITSETENNEKTANDLAQAVLNSVQFPQLVEVTDKDIISDMGIDLSLAEDYSVYQQMLSVDVSEVIILKAKEGKINEVTEQLEKRKKALINDFAIYPGQVASAEATVTGSKNNIAYLICHVDAAEAEEALKKAID